MAQKLELSGDMVEYVPDYLGGTACVPNGGTVALSLPAGTGAVKFTAEGGAAYWSVNVTNNGTLSHGYVAQNTSDMVFHCDNLGTVSVYAASGVTLHTQFYSS